MARSSTGNARQEKKSKTLGKLAGLISGSQKNKVIMYTSSRCRYCTMAKQYFDRKHISYTEHNTATSSSAKAEFRKIGGRGVPLIIVNGNKINGFNAHAIEQHLQ